MAKELDNKKMWTSLLEWGHLGVPKDAILSALKDQGYEYKEGKIVSIKPDSQRIVSAEAKEALLEDKEPELTELELHFGQFVFGDAWGKYDTKEIDNKFVKLCVRDVILPAARKQIASEINVDAMVEENYRPGKINPYFGQASTEKKAYRQGIEDTLKAIEKGE